MESVGYDKRDGAQRFEYVRDDDAIAAAAAYRRAAATHDPNQLIALLHRYPWHVDALLALSDVYAYAGQGAESAETLEKCLFALEGGWHPHFAAAAAAGRARMSGAADLEYEDEDEPTPNPNAPFFAALFKHAQGLTRRGCHRAALECSKLALRLDESDPRGFLCCVDYFALRCGEEDWLLDFANEFKPNASLCTLPGVAFSVALARLGGGIPGRRAEKARGSGGGAKGGGGGGGGKGGRGASKLAEAERRDADDALLRALLLHPAALPALTDRIDASATTSDARWVKALTHPFFLDARTEVRSRSLEHLYDLFAERHHLLWKPDEALRWLLSGALRAIDAADDMKRPIIDGLCPLDFASLRDETFPASDANAFSHLSADDFSDAVKRQMPEGDENPFMMPRPGVGPGPGGVPMEPNDVRGILDGIQLDDVERAVAAAGGRAAFVERLGGEDALGEYFRAREAANRGDDGPDPFGRVVDFFRTMLNPTAVGNEGGRLEAQMRGENAADEAAEANDAQRDPDAEDA